MCRFSVCQQVYGWLHADPIFAGFALLIVVFTMYRLAVRGRWITILIILAGWAAVAFVVLRVVPWDAGRAPGSSPRR